MLKKIKEILRKSWLAIRVYRACKSVLVFPLRFTPLRVLQLHNFPLTDLLHPRKVSLMMKVTPYTKNGYMRLSNVYDLAMDVEQRGLNGAFAECGTWKGGCTAVMGAVADWHGRKRKTWYLDSFEGMGKPSALDGEGTDEIAGDVLLASENDVKDIVFNKLHLSPEHNIIVKGWFEETLPRVKNEIGPIALLRLDADWYDPTVCILRELYDQIVPGGYIIFDDYGRWQGCKKAVDDFLKERGLQPKMQFVGNISGVFKDRLAPMYFQK